MQRVRRECGIARQDLLLKTIVFEEMRIQRLSCLPYSSKPNVRRTRYGSKPAFFAASMTVARAELFDGYRLRRVGIRIEEQGVVRARRLLLIWLFQQARAPLCLLHSESPRHGALLKQPDKQKAASSITAGVEAAGIELQE